LSPLSRLILGGVLAALVAVAARRTGSLSRSGALAAIAVGALACFPGWTWSGVLLAFFVSSTVLSAWRSASKHAATVDVVEKSAERDAVQVLANGGVFALAALGAVLFPSAIWAAVALGSLAAATADTWATEVGTAVGGIPRSIRGFARVPAGTSGAVTFAGSVAMVLGAVWLGTAARTMGFDPDVVLSSIVGGLGGALADTLLGATLQERDWCPRCARETEQRIHRCGTRTEHRRGLPGFGNDAVNLTSTVIGAAIAVLWSVS
jgi:uncharacterized protein (TIGR00297 family)